uniref:GNAT family N-acetyltransferase n=1 Tax=Stappia sp. TaxID=1870903 RepID=UPI003BA99420
MPQITLETDRLSIRPWRDDDREPFAAMCADPEVMRYFPAPLSRKESDDLIDRAIVRAEDDGVCFQPVERLEDGCFLGFVGLSRPAWQVPGAPGCVEIGWRLAQAAWGRGYASEAARAWCRFGFETLGLREIVSFTTVANDRSRRVMERLGMTHTPADDFDHPLIDADHPLSRHVLYRLARP